MRRQRLEHDIGQRDRLVGRLCLRRGKYRARAWKNKHLTLHGQEAAQEVDPVQADAERLALPYAGACSEHDQGPVTVRDRLDRELDLLRGRRLDRARYSRCVSDEKPPRVAGDERATLTSLLRYQRASLVKKVAGIDDRQASASPVSSGTSLLWLANHMADAESTWVLHRFAGQEVTTGGSHHEETVDSSIHRYQVVCEQVDAIVAASSLDELCRATDGLQPVDLRWILSHLVEETARHAGHADILRELIDGSVGR